MSDALVSILTALSAALLLGLLVTVAARWFR